MEDEDMIRQEMENTREAITEKLETLEHKLADSVLEATSAVSETVSTVKESVHDGVESVKDLFDMEAHMENHPWACVGGAVFCGYVLGAMLPRGETAPRPAVATPVAPPPRPQQAKGNGKHQVLQRTESTGESWFSMFKPEIDKLMGLALGATFGTIREMVAQEAPSHIAGQIRSIIDGVTEKLGGEPIPSTDFADRQADTADQWGNQRPSLDVEQSRW